jgi:hypothetical protein
MNEQLVQQLVATRTAIGAGAWLMPRFSGRLFGLDPDANPQSSYLGRLFGVRDVVLGVGLSSSSGADRQQWLRLGVACDLADAAAGVLAGRSGALPKRATLLVTVTALAAAAMGIAAMRGEEPPAPS